jgi:pimeloyl-ACP methyl ester carboxylesterase
MKSVVSNVLAAVLFGLLASVSFVSASQAAQTYKGFVTIAPGRALYAEYERPDAGKPTIVLLNGLTYRLGCWDRFTNFLRGHGYGILRYDPAGMGETLLKYAPATAAFPLSEQVNDLNNLLVQLRIAGPVHVVGLSYGGALGMQFAIEHADRVATLILMAPFVAPLESQDTWIKAEIVQTRILFPYNPASDDELYDFFLRQIIYATYPTAEPIVLENPYKLEATFRLVQGVRKFLAKDIAAKLPPAHTHMMIARQDQYLNNAVHDKFWSQLPAGVRASRLYIQGSEHKIPEAVPNFAASWVLRIVGGDPQISGGKTFEGNPLTGVAETPGLKIEQLGKE